MFRFITVTAATTAAATALILAPLAGAAPALAATPAPSAHKTLAEIQQAGATATADRIRDLTTGIGKVNSTSTLNSADKSTVLATLNHDLSGMQGLQSKIAADTTASVAATDYHSIFTGYRVYAVALPQSFIAASADGLTDTAIPRLQSAASKIAAVFAADPSKATPDLQAKLADMQAKTADAVTKTSGLAASALAVTPDAYNANHSVLVGDRAAAHAALADSKAASQDGKAIVAALKVSNLSSRRSGRALVVLPAVALTLALALTGCGNLGAAGSSGPSGAASPASTGAAPSPASSPAAAPDSSTLDSISQDLGAADTANSQADSNGQAADQAAATSDEP